MELRENMNKKAAGSFLGLAAAFSEMIKLLLMVS
jgi:hypothetical protein